MKALFSTLWVILIAIVLCPCMVAQSKEIECDCFPDEVIFELINPADLPAIAAQYKLVATPIAQLGY